MRQDTEGAEIRALLTKYPDAVIAPEQVKSIAAICAAQTSVPLLQICMERYHWQINDALNFEQQTVLHIAAKQGNKDFVLFLINKGADVRQEDAYGKTALDYASNKEVKTVLKEKAKK